MKRGRKPVPKMLRELHGNPRQRRASSDEPEGVGDLWAPPPWFDDEQRAQWNYALDHAPPGLLTGTDRGVLTVWCVACVMHAKAAQAVREFGQVVKTTGGNEIQNPFLGIVNRQAAIMLKAGAEMGFSPAARTSLGSSAPEFGRRGRTIRGGLAAYLKLKPDDLQ